MQEIRIAFSRWVITLPLAVKDIPFPKLRAILDSIFSGISENLQFIIGVAATPVYQIIEWKSLRTKVFFFCNFSIRTVLLQTPGKSLRMF